MYRKCTLTHPQELAAQSAKPDRRAVVGRALFLFQERQNLADRALGLVRVVTVELEISGDILLPAPTENALRGSGAPGGGSVLPATTKKN